MRILAGEAPGNLLELLRVYFGLSQDSGARMSTVALPDWNTP